MENVSARACYIHLSVVFHVSRAEEVELLVFCGAFLTSEPSSLSCSFDTNNQNILNVSFPPPQTQYSFCSHFNNVAGNVSTILRDIFKIPQPGELHLKK